MIRQKAAYLSAAERITLPEDIAAAGRPIAVEAFIGDHLAHQRAEAEFAINLNRP
jgi:hypothetical protein